MLGWLSGAPRRIGFSAPQGRELSLWLNNERVEPTAEHVVDRYLQLLYPLGARETLEAHFELPVRDQAVVDALIRDTHLSEGFAVLNPGAGWDSKLWPARRFGQLARCLGECHRLPSVVAWAGDREHAWAEEIVERAGGHAWLAPPTTLPELATLMHRAASLCGRRHRPAASGCRGGHALRRAVWTESARTIRRVRIPAHPRAGLLPSGLQS